MYADDSTGNDDPVFKKSFADNLNRTKLAPYPLLTARPEDAMEKVREIVEAGNDLDIVFFDLPRTINNRGVVNILNCMDTVIVPIAASPSSPPSSSRKTVWRYYLTIYYPVFYPLFGSRI